MSQQIDINCFAGDSFTRRVTIQAKDADGSITPIDLTDFTCFFTAKRNEADSQDRAVIHETWSDHEDAENGITKIELSLEQTAPVGSYVYAFGYFTSDDQKKTLWAGKITFKKTADTSTEA